ncbi:MAG: hypothetical protein V4484_12710 [Pseudomonadota bacterium]
MKAIGVAILVIGIVLAIYALTMSVGIDVPPHNLGIFTTPAISIANADLVAKRQGYLIISGILAVAGVIMLVLGGKK